MQTVDVYFNNYNLNALPGVKVTNHNVNEMPNRTLNLNKLARQDRSLMTSAEYSDKSIYVYGYVGGADHLVAEYNYNTLKSYLQDVEGVVRVNLGGTDVEYTGTLNAISKDYVGLNIKFTLEFKCANPIGREAVGQNLFTDQTITTSTKSVAVNILGSFKARPRFKIVINSVTGGSPNKNISITNGVTGQGIKITRSFSAGDIININSDTFEVLVNTVAVDFSGQFPVFLPGPRTIQYIDDFTTRNVTLSGIYQKQYA